MCPLIMLKVYTLFQTGYSTDFFQNFRQLRALTLMNSKDLPNSVDTLIHLKYLHLNDYSSELPETIGNMCNLQILKVTWFDMYDIVILPSGLVKLINLTHLILLGACLAFLEGFGRLVSLRRLENFMINDLYRCNLGELNALNNLQGSFKIYELGNVVDVSEAKIAQLKKKTHLQDLSLSFEKGRDAVHIYLMFQATVTSQRRQTH